ncbi:MAG: bifunctional adenosylcobinamide kinase/adenosylcobinamide-phosphate guanylyltransferase [Actinomycetota bacterium]
MLVFVTGGARSGKSTAAVEAARHSGRPVTFVATATAGDGEMTDRIAAHRAERPPEWSTIEAPVEVADALNGAEPDACVLVDCLSLWVSNLLMADAELGTAPLDRRLDAIVAAARARPGPTIVVSNEVGSGIVPDNALARAYRDLLGRANQRLAAEADAAYLTVSGRLLELGQPSELLRV